jgi:hypothetical protein
MYTVKRTAPNIIEIKESILSFVDTKTTYWYIDTERWLSSYIGKQDEIPTWPMSEKQIEWAKKYYLPKIKEGE